MMNWLKMVGNNGGERRSGSEISSYHNYENEGGCGWGLIHVIKHHHWSNFMRRITHHKRKRLIGNHVTQMSDEGMEESDKLIVVEEETETVLAQQKNNNSIKSRMKAILAEEVNRIKGQRNSSSSKRDKASVAAMNPDSQERPKHESADKHNKKSSESSSTNKDGIVKLKPIRVNPKEYLDALNIISANEEFLVKVLHDPGSPLAHHFRNQQALNTKQGLIKSQTFPPPGSSEKRVPKPSRLKPMKMAEPELVSPDKKSHGESRVGKRRFKDFKQRIKQMIRERRKEMRRVAMDATIDKIPRDQKASFDSKQFKNFETCDGQGKDSPVSGYESDFSAPSFGRNKSRLRRMTRASSLNESMDRYCQLYESSFNKETMHQKSSDGVKRLELVSKNLKRIYSLPDLESYLNPNDESSDDFSLEIGDGKHLIHSRRSVDEQTNEDFSKDQLQTDFPMEIIVEEDRINSPIENELTFTSSESDETTKLSIGDAVENIIEEDPIDQISTTISMTENNSTKSNKDNKIKHESEEQALPNETENTNQIHDTLQMKEQDKAEFSYVKDILELSGFSGDISLGTNWHSETQPLNPSVYEEASKGCLIFDPDCCGNESNGKCDHPLLFDLINEVLMEIYARSYSYYPFPLTSLSHISPMPIGQHVLGQVWGLISWYLSLRSEAEYSLSLDCIVGSDLAKSGNWWMNLQFDCECVGLEIEEFIFQDLLEEIILPMS